MHTRPHLFRSPNPIPNAQCHVPENPNFRHRLEHVQQQRKRLLIEVFFRKQLVQLLVFVHCGEKPIFVFGQLLKHTEFGKLFFLSRWIHRLQCTQPSFQLDKPNIRTTPDPLPHLSHSNDHPEGHTGPKPVELRLVVFSDRG